MTGARRRSRPAVVVLLMLAAPAAARAQQPTPTPQERVLERLRSLPSRPVLVRDTLTADSLAADSLAADSLAADSLAAARSDSMAHVAGPTPRTRAGADSVQALLLSMEGYTAVRYTGDRAEFATASDRLRLGGKAHVTRGEESITTDSLLVYDGQSDVVCGYGKPVLEGEGNAPVESDSLCFNTRQRVGMANGARTTFSKGATWYVQGPHNRVFTVGNDELYAERTDFTSCDLPEPHYHFSAAKVKMVSDEVMVARDVTLNFADVPVFWLPFMVQTMKRGRRSGILMPQFGVNDIVRNSVGYTRRISNMGFYWAVNDYMGAQLSADWWAENFLGVEGRFDYSWMRQFLNGGATVKRFWRDSGRKELTLTANSRWQPTERTSMALDAQYASASEFIVQNSLDPQELNRDIRSNFNLRHRFDWGSLSFGAQRRQYLSQDRVDLTLPNVGLSLSPITISQGLGITWSGQGSFTNRSTGYTGVPTPGQRDTRGLQAGLSSNLDLGGLRVAGSADFKRDETGLDVDSAGAEAAPAFTRDEVTWNSSVGYTINLMPGTTLTPSLQISGTMVDDTLTAGYVSAPNRINTGASIGTTIYGFWPGVGPIERIRHKISPSISWRYSPRPETTPEQDSVFGVNNLRENNVVSLSFNQTFEAKMKGGPDTADVEVPEPGAAPPTGEPRRLPQARKIQLLAITTSAIGYDFVKEREEGWGWTINQFTTGLRSGLLEGFNVSLTHDVFNERRVVTPTDTTTDRTFSPFLTNVSASFSLDSNFWLFRALGLSGFRREAAAQDTAGARPDSAGVPGGPQGPQQGQGMAGNALMGGGARSGFRGGNASVGGWSAQLTYSMVRRRPDPDAVQTGQDNQLLRGNLTYRPSELWSVSWNTSYSFTTGEFSDHHLTLSRDLHRWRANFDFVKTQTGNFAFVFRVDLIDNPDLKFDYAQRNNQTPNRF